MQKFPIVLADPNWKYKVWNNSTGAGRSADKHYQTRPSDEMRQWDVPSLMEKDSILALWVTGPMIFEAETLARHWGLSYGTILFAWIKTNPKAMLDPRMLENASNWFFGLGHSTRSNVELVLSFKRGKGVRVQSHSVPQLIVAPRARHSQKPDECNRRLDLLYPGDKCELFSRRQYLNWTCVGDEMPENPMKLEDFLIPYAKLSA